MKRYAFPLTIILLLITVVALAAPGDKRPAVTSAAIGLGTSSSATMASITATTSVTAPAYNSTAADGYHYILPYNSTAFSGTPLTGMIQTTPTGPQWYTGSAWEAIGSGGGGTWGSITGTLSAQTDLQAALDAITAGGITISTGTPSTPGTAYLNDTTHVLTVASTTGYTQFTGSFTAWDTTPAAFSFTDETDIALSTAKTSNAITVAGINYPAAISVTGDTGFGYSKNSAACTATSGTVVAGDTVSACVTSSGSNSTATTTTVTIGGVNDTYSVTTAAGGATYVVNDTFTGTDGTLIQNHTGETGATWTKETGANDATIINNRFVSYVNDWTLYHPSGIPASANYSVEADLYAASVTPGFSGGVICRGDGSANNFYRARYSTDTGSWELSKYTSGNTILGQYFATLTVGNTYNVKLSCSGSTITMYIDGVQRAQVTDTSITSKGFPGVFGSGGSVSTGYHIDNVKVTDL